MAELPTPHSIAIGTLISLYSDPNSPLVVFDWHSNNSEVGENDEQRAIVGSDSRHRLQRNHHQQQEEPRHSSVEWSLKLMDLIQQLVMREDEGVVVLPNDDELGSLLLRGGNDNNPADDDDDGCYNDDVDLTIIGSRDSIELENILSNDDFFKKHGLFDGQADILEDVLGLFSGGSSPELQCVDNTGKRPKANRIVGNNNNISGTDGSLNFCMEPLSTLLDRIDDAYHFTSSSSLKLSKCSKRRTPPSLALLSRLQMASSSVDDLMNLLDEWHALLEGVHVGYPPPSTAGDTNGITPVTTIGVDGESTFGVYLRRLSLGMEEIPFEALSRLWDALREFVREEMKMEKSRIVGQQEDGKCCNDDEGNDGIIDEVEEIFKCVSDWLPSSPQIERIVRRTCLTPNLESLLQLPSNSSPSSSPPSNKHLHNLLLTHPECPSLHFLLYLSSLANGHRYQALESLHRYFDYAMIHERKERAERAIMLQASGEAGEGGAAGGGVGNGATGMGMVTTMASSMGGITGGMNGTVAMGDATMQGGQQRGAGAGNNNQSGKLFKESNVMQYAAILLAQTYYRFGYTRLAIQATEEAVRVAQQCGDEECVCFANGWLALVNSSVGNDGSGAGSGGGGGAGGVRGASSVYASVGSLSIHGRGYYHYRPLAPPASIGAIGSSTLTSQEEEAMLYRCQTRATERGLTSLAAGASLELARRLAHRRGQGGESGDDTMEEYVSSSSAWMSIQSAGRIPSMAGSSSTTIRGQGVSAVSAGAGGVARAPTDIYNMSNTDALSILGRQNIATAGLWESTGHMSLASLSSCAALYGSGGSNLGGGKEMAPDMATMNRVLSSFTNGPGLDVWMRDNTNGGEQANGKTYATILNNLISLSEGKHNNNNSERIVSSAVSSTTLHEWSVRSYDLSIARGLHTLLANHAIFPSSSSSGGGGDGAALPAVEASLVFLTQSTHLFTQCEEYDRAKVMARRACWLASKHSLVFHLGWQLLQLALIDLEASTSSSSCAPSTNQLLSVERSLPPLLECLHLSEQYSMDPLRAIALATLSKVFLCMGRYRKARAILQAAMPLVMQHGHVWFQGEGFLTLAKCYLAEAAACSREEKGLAASASGGGIVVGSSSSGKRKRQQQQQQHDSTSLELRETALSQLKKAAFHFTQIEDIQRLRQVYYLQARVCHSLPNAKKKQRDEAAKMFAQLSVQKRERVVDSVMMGNNRIVISKGKQKKMSDSGQQWDVLRGVMITDLKELKCCVSMKLQR